MGVFCILAANIAEKLRGAKLAAFFAQNLGDGLLRMLAAPQLDCLAPGLVELVVLKLIVGELVQMFELLVNLASNPEGRTQ